MTGPQVASGHGPMFDHTHYVPVLRWKRGERAAVKALHSNDKVRMTPLLRGAGYLLLPTFAVPHDDIVLEEASEVAARRLLAYFGPVLDNPYKRRR